MKFKRVMAFASALLILAGCVSSSQPDSQMSSSASDIYDKASEATFDMDPSYDTDDSSENTSAVSSDNTTATPIYFFGLVSCHVS